MRANASLIPVILVSVLAAALAGCGRRETPAAEGIRTRTLLVGNSAEPADLDPHLAEAFTDQILLVALHEGLTVLDERTSRPLPGVAESWETSTDGLTWTFRLRAGERWSNGEPLTAHDFVFSFRRLLSPALGASLSYMFWAVRGAEAFNTGKLTDFAAVGVSAPDDRTLRLELAHPVPHLAALAAHSSWLPVHRPTLAKFDSVTKRGGAWTRPGNHVGNGPFTLAEWRPNARLVVSRNPLYRDAATNRLERVVFLPVEKAEVEELNFRAGQMHLTFALPASKVDPYQRESPSPLRVDPLLNVTYVNFNVTRPPLDNPKVRRALALAIDRDAISRAVFQGTRAAAPSFTPPDCGGYNARARIATNAEAARALLAEAGFPGGRGLPVFPVQVQNDSTYPRIMEAIQAMWLKELGVRSTIEPFEQKTWVQNQQSKQHVIGLMGWTGDYPDPLTFLGILRGDGGNNWTGWANPAYDQLIAETERTPDAAPRLELFQRAEALLLQEAPVTPLVFGSRTYLIHPAVRGWEPSPLGLHRFQLIELRE